MTWLPLAAAPLKTLGHLWGPRLGDRTDIIGLVHEYTDGARFGSANTTQGIEFTHWHPLPAPPASGRAADRDATPKASKAGLRKRPKRTLP